MQIIHHAMIAVIAMILLFPYMGLNVLWIFASGVLVDFDHYFWYYFRVGKENPIKSYNAFFKKRKFEKYLPILCIFHTFEFAVVLSLLAYLMPFFIPLLVGYFIHMISDLIADIATHTYGDRKRWIILELLDKY